MVQLADKDIKTREVLEWKGVHIFHFFLSSCSQKLRIFLNLKAIDWQSHPIDLFNNENLSEWYMGINPRGLVPVLVHNGAVHIESNDIITYLEKQFPEPRLILPGSDNTMTGLLRHEDDLHMDLRALSFRFVFAPPSPPKSLDDLKQYASAGSGTVGGEKDPQIAKQIDFWQLLREQGITDKAASASALKFRRAFEELEERLANHPYLLGDTPTVLDIAWFIYVNRLSLAGYPLHRLHPRLANWFAGLYQRPEFAKEIVLPADIGKQFDATRREHAQQGKSLELVAGL